MSQATKARLVSQKKHKVKLLTLRNKSSGTTRPVAPSVSLFDSVCPRGKVCERRHHVSFINDASRVRRMLSLRTAILFQGV